MLKLYLVVAHNLNEARKARDRNKKKKNPKDPELLKIGDNVLVRDHTSKAFQLKYKDFWITGLLGKNQVEIKDNHGHTTKVYHRDIKKIQMTEKVCQLYKEEQIAKLCGPVCVISGYSRQAVALRDPTSWRPVRVCIWRPGQVDSTEISQLWKTLLKGNIWISQGHSFIRFHSFHLYFMLLVI